MSQKKNDPLSPLDEAIAIAEQIFCDLREAPPRKDDAGNLYVELTPETPYAVSEPLAMRTVLEAIALQHDALRESLPRLKDREPDCLITWETDDDDSPLALSGLKIEFQNTKLKLIPRALGVFDMTHEALITLCAIAQESVLKEIESDLRTDFALAGIQPALAETVALTASLFEGIIAAEPYLADDGSWALILKSETPYPASDQKILAAAINAVGCLQEDLETCLIPVNENEPSCKISLFVKEKTPPEFYGLELTFFNTDPDSLERVKDLFRFPQADLILHCNEALKTVEETPHKRQGRALQNTAQASVYEGLTPHQALRMNGPVQEIIKTAPASGPLFTLPRPGLKM